MIDFRELVIEFAISRFIEDDPVPSDGEVIGTTWAKTNKDGSPDRRFSDNRQVPIVRYGVLRLTSQGGLREEYCVSNANLCERFYNAWAAFRSSFGIGSP